MTDDTAIRPRFSACRRSTAVHTPASGPPHQVWPGPLTRHTKLEAGSDFHPFCRLGDRRPETMTMTDLSKRHFLTLLLATSALAGSLALGTDALHAMAAGTAAAMTAGRAATTMAATTIPVATMTVATTMLRRQRP